MMFVTGIVLFALAILISVALHECGHMWVARRTGMKVRRYFVGFGPTLWSTRRGETEYGVKAVPLGGFCDIAGMTPVEELDPDERDRAMYKQATWKRVAVLFAGPGMNLAICLVLIYAIALVWGLPNLHPPTRAVIGETGCVAQEVSQGKLEQCTGPGPAALAGIRSGDVVVKVGDTPVSSFDEMAAAVRKSHGSVPIVVERDGTAIVTYVDIESTQRWIPNGQGGELQPATAATVTPAAPAALAAPAAPATTALSLGWVATEVRAALAAMVLPASVAGAGWVAPGAPAAPATRGPLEQAPVGPVATGGRAVAAASASSLVSAVSAASVARGPSPQVPPAAPVAAVASAGSAAANSCRPRGSPRRHAAMLLPVGRYPPTSRHGIGRRTGLPGSPTRGPANSITSAGQPMMPVIADQPIITAIKPAARPAPHFCDVRCST